MSIRQMKKDEVLRAKELINNGTSKSAVARHFQVTRVTLRKAIREFDEFGDACFDTKSKPYPFRSKQEKPNSPINIVREYQRDCELWAALLYGRTG